jgi:hypothetical protein
MNKIQSPVTYSEFIVPVCIPNSLNANFAGKVSWATGFGQLAYQGHSPSQLMEVEMPILTDARCKQKYPNSFTAVHLCAGDNQNKDTCQVEK